MKAQVLMFDVIVDLTVTSSVIDEIIRRYEGAKIVSDRHRHDTILCVDSLRQLKPLRLGIGEYGWTFVLEGNITKFNERLFEVHRSLNPRVLYVTVKNYVHLNDLLNFVEVVKPKK